MNKSTPVKVITILIHAFVVWALCGAIMMIGRPLIGIELTLIAHAIGAPIFAGLASLIYHKKFGYTTPLQTAFIFVLFPLVMDAGLVAPVFEKSYEMFRSVLGLWIPMALMFSSTYIVGIFAARKNA